MKKKLKYFSDDECHSTDEERDSEDELEKKGPRILKPGEKPLKEQNEAAMKAIRGRRKQIHSSPAKRMIQANASSVPASPKITAATLTNKKLSSVSTKSLPNVPKSIQKTESPTLCREETFTKDEGTSSAKLSEKKQLRSIPVLNKKPDMKTSNANSSFRHKSAPVMRYNKPVDVKTGRPATTYISKNSDKASSNLNRHSSGSSAGSKFSGFVDESQECFNKR